MKRTSTARVVLAAGLLVSLGACSSGGPGVETTPAGPANAVAPGDASAISGGDLSDARARELAALEDAREAMLATPATVEIGASCDEFNAIMVDVHEATSDTYGGVVSDAYSRAMDAKEVAPDETFRLFDTLSQLATEMGSGTASQPTLDAVSDAVSDTEAACSAAGVTLTP